MSNFRESLIDRMIHLYGFENPIVIDFCRLCESWAQGDEWDHLLEVLVSAHEASPIFDEDD